MFKKILATGAVAAAALSGVALAGGAASAAPLVTATTHVTGNLDTGGSNGAWAVLDYNRTLTVTPVGANSYTATVSDKGTFVTLPGKFAPNQGAGNLGSKISHAVKGSFSGGAAYSFTVSGGTASAANVAAAVNDHFTKPTAGENSTSQWFLQAFPGSTTAVSGGITGNWGWKYSTGCESWTDFSTNDGQVTADGNITGKTCHPVAPFRPYVYNGHIVTLQGTRAAVAWTDSVHGWPNPAQKCVVVQEYGPGFTGPLGQAHTGYTCDTTGYLTGMQIGHGYSLFIWPAQAGDSYAGSHAIVPGSDNAHVYLVATAS